MHLTIDGEALDIADEARYIISPATQHSRSYRVIRRPTEGQGFFSGYLVIYTQIINALANQMIPVVDWRSKRPRTYDLAADNLPDNHWEYYFRQPTKRVLDDAYTSRYIVSNADLINEYMPVDLNLNGYLIDAVKMKIAHSVASSMMRFNETANKYIKKAEPLLNDPALTIGVHYSGASRRRHVNIYCDDPSPTIYTFANKMDVYLAKTDVPHIFIATDEQAALDVFVKRYGRRVIHTDAFRIPRGESREIGSLSASRLNHEYMLGLEAFRDAYLLSKCGKLMHTSSSAAAVAIIMNGDQYAERMYVPPFGISLD